MKSSTQIPAGIPAAIQHVLYIVKENRSYDQVLGDIGKGESDPSLCLFKENVSPNHHKLAREFVLFDNFYVNSDVSADGHNWSTSAIANDYVEKMWPSNYAKRNPNYDFEGGEPAAYPPAGYLWTNAAAAGVSMRNYGYWVENKKEPGADGIQIDKVLDPVLAKVTNMKYRSFDLDYPDVKRAQTFLDDLAQFESANQMPALMIMRLGNDHTSGHHARQDRAAVVVRRQRLRAGHDCGGRVAQQILGQHRDFRTGRRRAERPGSRGFAPLAGVHHFALHAPRHRGQQHVQHHVHAAHHGADSAFASHDALRRGRAADVRKLCAAAVAAPYQAEKPRISLEERNPANSSTAARSARLDFSKEDLNDDDELNDILWRAIRGTDPPPPVRSMFGR